MARLPASCRHRSARHPGSQPAAQPRDLVRACTSCTALSSPSAAPAADDCTALRCASSSATAPRPPATAALVRQLPLDGLHGGVQLLCLAPTVRIVIPLRRVTVPPMQRRA